MPKNRCEWCANPDAGDAQRPEDLCRTHEAEYEGLSVNELDRRDREQAAEYREWVLGH